VNKYFSGILWGLLVLSFCILPVQALEREDCGTFIGTPEIAGENRPETSIDSIQVYPLHVGDTLVSYEQFYGGTEAYDEAALNVIVNSERFFVAPVYMFLVIHPNYGAFVVDTAINEEMAFNYDEYFSGLSGISSRMMQEEYYLDESQTVPAQLARFGYTPEDIELVILTHSHDDHVGGLPYFQHARIVVAEDEFTVIELVSTNTLPVNGKYYDGVTCWEPISFTDGAIANFEQSQDVFGDGSVTLLPAPGHTAGSLMVLVDLGDYNLLLTGDTIYTIYHLDPDNFLQLIPDTDSEQIANTVREVVQLGDTLPGTYIVPAHDHSGYLENVLPTLMNCGILTDATRQYVRDYQSVLFDDAGHVRTEYAPQYIANEDGSIYGEVFSPPVDIAAHSSPDDCEN